MPEKIKLIVSTRPVWVLLVAVIIALVVGLLIPVEQPIRGPLVDINDTILIAVLVALGGLVAQLYLRMGKLESDLNNLRVENDRQRTESGALRDDLRAATSFIDRIGLWMLAGSPPNRRPRPPQQLTDQIDAELWAESPAVGGTDD